MERQVTRAWGQLREQNGQPIASGPERQVSVEARGVSIGQHRWQCYHIKVIDFASFLKQPEGLSEKTE